MTRVLSVAAPGNGSGKTLLLAACLREHPGKFTAVKFTTVFRDGANCPRTGTACACRNLHGRFTVVTDAGTLGIPDTDTGRLTGAGARAVLWCLARPDAHAEAWEHIRRDLIPDATHVATEGNTAIPVLRPSLLLFVASPRVPRDRWKADAGRLMERADLAIVNRHGCDDASVAALVEEIASRRGGATPPAVDVSAPIDTWGATGLREALARLVASPGGTV